MSITSAQWSGFLAQLRKVNDAATERMLKFIRTAGIPQTQEQMNAAIDFAFGLATKYGEAAAELACQMHDAVAIASGLSLPAAEPAPTATIGEVAKAIRGTAKTGNAETIASSVGRQVKMAGVDTTMKNALRDGAYWAWIPHGDTCAFCLMLASNGWQRASKKAIKGGHAEHIHANCDCTYAISFNGKGTVEGYDPDKYKAMYDNAEGDTWKEKLNSMRRQQYAENAPTLRAQKNAAYAARREREKGLLEGGGSGIVKAGEPIKRITAIPASTVTEKVNSGEYSLRLSDQNYNKHVLGHRDYERYARSRDAKGQNPPSYLTVSKAEAQNIINEKSGTGIIRTRRDGTATNQEMITCDTVIGAYFSHGEWHDTNKAIIHHGKDGSHIVPHAGGNYD